MLRSNENASLKELNTFGIDEGAKYLIDYDDISELINYLKLNKNLFDNYPVVFLGEGSNILFTKSFGGIVLRSVNQKIEKINENSENIYLEVSSGTNWDFFVNYCVSNNLHGIENLSLIPGTVGACPVQNIGAYGVEVKDVIFGVNVLNIKTLEYFSLNNQQCQFAYRNSIFKHKSAENWLVTSVVFELKKNAKLHTTYKDVEAELQNDTNITLQKLRQAIITIRQRKLPDYKVLGNAGSFFKNPVVFSAKALELQSVYPQIVTYRVSDTETKLAAAWLIEKSGWKGKRIGNVGVHAQQSLVLINYGNAKGAEILNLASEIQLSIYEMFDVNLEIEVRIL